MKQARQERSDPHATGTTQVAGDCPTGGLNLARCHALRRYCLEAIGAKIELRSPFAAPWMRPL